MDEAKTRYINGKMLYPRYRVLSSMGELILDVYSRDIHSDEDLRGAIFEFITLMNTIPRSNVMFYYVPEFDDKVNDVMLSLHLFENQVKSIAGMNIIFNKETSEWEKASGSDTVFDPTINGVPTKVLQAVVCGMSMDKNDSSVLSFKTVKKYLETLGYSFIYPEGINDDNIMQIISTNNYKKLKDELDGKLETVGQEKC